MDIIEKYKVSIDDYLDSIACDILTDQEYELEFQGMYIQDKGDYLARKGINILPIINSQLN